VVVEASVVVVEASVVVVEASVVVVEGSVVVVELGSVVVVVVVVVLEPGSVVVVLEPGSTWADAGEPGTTPEIASVPTSTIDASEQYPRSRHLVMPAAYVDPTPPPRTVRLWPACGPGLRSRPARGEP
jgi:hypothetical protein